MKIERTKICVSIMALSLFSLSGCVTNNHPAPAAKAEEQIYVDNNKHRSHIDQGMLYVNQNDMANAINEFKESINIKPTVEGYANLGAAYMQLGKNNLALDALQKGEALNPNDPILNYNITALYSLRDEVDLSLLYLDKSLSNGFSNVDALRFDPDLANLRGEPEFRTTLEKHKFFIQ